MKSSKNMYKLVHDTACQRIPRRHEGMLGYAIDMTEVYKIFFDNSFSSKRNTRDLYIGEWIDFGLAMKDSTGRVLWIIDSKLKGNLEFEKKNHTDCQDLQVLA